MLRNFQSVFRVLGRQTRQYSVKSDHAVWSLGRLNHVAIAVGLITISLFHLIQLTFILLVCKCALQSRPFSRNNFNFLFFLHLEKNAEFSVLICAL